MDSVRTNSIPRSGSTEQHSSSRRSMSNTRRVYFSSPLETTNNAEERFNLVNGFQNHCNGQNTDESSPEAINEGLSNEVQLVNADDPGKQDSDFEDIIHNDATHLGVSVITLGPRLILDDEDDGESSVRHAHLITQGNIEDVMEHDACILPGMEDIDAKVYPHVSVLEDDQETTVSPVVDGNMEACLDSIYDFPPERDGPEMAETNIAEDSLIDRSWENGETSEDGFDNTCSVKPVVAFGGNEVTSVDGNSLAIYQNLNDSDSIGVINKADRGMVTSQVDSSSDYKTAIDYDECSYNNAATVINIVECDYISQDQMKSLTESHKDAVRYMKTREMNRYYTLDIHSCSWVTCAVNSLVFISLVSTTLLLSHILKQIYAQPEFAIHESIGDAICEVALMDLCISISLLAGTLVNLYCFGSHSIYYRMVVTTLGLFVLFAIIVVEYLLSLFHVIGNDKNIASHMGWFLDLHYNICIGRFCSYNLVSLLYKVVLAFFNIWILFNRFILPHLLVRFAEADSRRIKVASIDRCNIAVPNHPVFSDRHGTTSVVGYIVNFDYMGDLGFLWKAIANILGLSTRNAHPSGMIYQYVGQLNKDLRPHGYGLWQGASSYGEVLIGYWEHGLPLGTFKSMEYKTRSTSSQIMMGWVKCPLGGGITMGVAAVEMCTKNNGYHLLPRVTKYRAEIFDEDTVSEGVIKEAGTLEEISDIGVEYPQNDDVILRLYKVYRNLVPFDFGDCSAYLRDCKKRNGVFGNFKSRLCNMLTNRPGVTQLGRVFKSIFKTLEHNTPSFVEISSAKISISTDTCLNLYVDGYVPFDVTFDSDLSPLAYKKNQSMSLKVDENYDGIKTGLPKPTLLKPTVEPVLIIPGWKKRGSYKSPEVCVFIHGPHSSSEKSLQDIAQLYCSCNYPQYVKPIFFGWPPFCSVSKKDSPKYEESLDGCKEALERFLRALLMNSITDIHLVVDTSAVSIFLETFALITNMKDSYCIFRGVNDYSEMSVKCLNLLTVTLMFPECNMERFVNALYMPLRKHCDIVTVYGYTATSKWWKYFLDPTKHFMSKNITSFWTQRKAGTPNISMDHKLYIDGSPTLGSITLPPISTSIPSDNDCLDEEIIWLDVDCIDVTWLSSLSTASKCNRWQYCKEIADDLRELIVCRKRAKDRITILDRVVGNIWVHK
ncbi:uncharacterized protein BBOV_IV007270 [Babesia bovis T2Bo]|uniref:Uncharacterized protein n=1 Tax=Babesia bovis TaxID=5865 RepID=A7ARB4_BABBO|nr:uncharacterized protein BBOV_IV007270 [Babesia bovis T2Bo]EDO07083.1 hypothetical protein BBOV_IV007270 [Babesia bovis T2Bo]|eukprot:XP_001610651.1 hypothetical protein [Babesia bovis T2Bo]